MPLKLNRRHAGLALAATFFPMPIRADAAQPMVFEDFQNNPETRWTYVADGVMGGVSQGQAELAFDNEGTAAIRLTGQVSTQNNGGFIQVRNRFGGGWSQDRTGLAITAKGNGETYYVFLRTAGLARVWFSYRHAFQTTPNWAETVLPFEAFGPSHGGMPPKFTPDQVISIGIVAYGREHQADVSVRRILLT